MSRIHSLSFFGLVMLLMFSSGSRSNSQSFLTNGLVAFFPFDGNAKDATGTNDGVVIGNDLVFGLNRFGEPTSSLFLNGTSNASPFLEGTYISIPRPLSLDFNTN